VLKEHFNFYSRHFFDRALVLLLKSGFLVLYTSLVTWSIRNHSNILNSAQEIFIIIINVKNICAASYFCEKW